MRKAILILVFLLLGGSALYSQSFSIFPQDKKLDACDTLLVSEPYDNDSLEAKINMPQGYEFGALNGSLFERFQGGNNSHIWAIHWVSDSTFFDSGELIPLLLVDLYGKDTIKNILWCISALDTALIDFKWVSTAAQNDVWRNWAWEQRWERGDTFAYFVLEDYLLPLPCNHESMYLYYGGSEDITLTIDLDFASGLNLEECLDFIQDHVNHLLAFHNQACLSNTPQLTLEVGVRNASIGEIREFMRDVSEMGIRIELVFPWEP